VKSAEEEKKNKKLLKVTLTFQKNPIWRQPIVLTRNSQWVIEHLVALAHFVRYLCLHQAFGFQLETKHTQNLLDCLKRSIRNGLINTQQGQEYGKNGAGGA